MIVPIYVDFDGQMGRLGTVRIVGNTSLSNLQLKLPKKPQRLLINAYHDVLSR